MKLRRRGRIELLREGDKIKFYLELNLPAKYYHPEMKQVIKGEGIKESITINVRQLTNLYLSMKDYENSFEKPIVFKDGKTQIKFYKIEDKPMTLVIFGMNPDKNEAGIWYLDVLNYTYVLLLAYLKEFLSSYPVLSFEEGTVEFGYNREDNMILITDKELNKHHYIEEENIAVIQEIFDNYKEQNILFTHSFTPDRNIYIDKETEKFYVNSNKFPLDVFKKLVYLTRI